MTHQPGATDDAADDVVVEQFHPTSGRIPGVMGLITAGVVLAIALYDRSTGTPLGVAICACAGAVLVWAALLRPTAWVTGRDLVLRSILRTDRVPLVAIDEVAISQVLAVRAGERRFVCPAIGYTTRQTVRGKAGERVLDSSAHQQLGSGDAYQTYVAQRIMQLAKEARERAGVTLGSPEQAATAAGVRREWAWLELAALGLLALVFAVWLVA
ncbi:hypothetical protein ABLE68_02540 [Nocardioides sp. CN2-186]|uniref:hypothetical protein n=1 Tax=Nocardioides tweenelious TaxID=3156607 RepID=UPI0032B34C0B